MNLAVYRDEVNVGSREGKQQNELFPKGPVINCCVT